MRRNQEWNDPAIVAGLVKAFQVKRIAMHLLHSVWGKFACADLVFKYQHKPAQHHNGIGPPTHARDGELEEEVGGRKRASELAEMCNLELPRFLLRKLERKRQTIGQSAQDRVRVSPRDLRSRPLPSRLNHISVHQLQKRASIQWWVVAIISEH